MKNKPNLNPCVFSSFSASCVKKVAKNGAVLDNFGVFLEKNGTVLDKFGIVWDMFGYTSTPKNRVFSTKNNEDTIKTLPPAPREKFISCG